MKQTPSPLFAKSPTARPVRSPGSGLLTLIICHAVPLAALAQTTDFSPSAPRVGVTAPSGDVLMLTPFKYIPPPGADPAGKTSPSSPAEAEKPKRPPDQQRIVDLNAAGDFQATGTEGLVLIAKKKPDDELQLIIANSLAWTNRPKQAIPVYEGLAGGKYASQGTVAVGNIHRWSGRDDLAAPLYRSVLASDPFNDGALEGMEMASRELSPRTMLSFGGGKDSSDEQRRSGTLNHRWRDSSKTQIMEIETSGVKDTLPGLEAKQGDATFRYQNLNLALKPSLELTMLTTRDRNFYGSVRIKLFDDQITLDGGRVNWGRMASNPNALASRLSATHAGLVALLNYSFGNLYGRADYYGISDGNTILTSSLNLATAWRPLGSHFKPYVGFETRGAKYASPNYWSPAQGAGSYYGGLLGEWGAPDWNLYGSGQLGGRLFGDAGTSWSVSAGGKTWITSNIALSASFWAMSSWRDNAVYNARAATVNLEKLWR